MTSPGVAGGFELVREDVNINDLGALVMNIRCSSRPDYKFEVGGSRPG
jgi:hypothetical protein